MQITDEIASERDTFDQMLPELDAYLARAHGWDESHEIIDSDRVSQSKLKSKSDVLIQVVVFLYLYVNNFVFLFEKATLNVPDLPEKPKFLRSPRLNRKQQSKDDFSVVARSSGERASKARATTVVSKKSSTVSTVSANSTSKQTTNKVGIFFKKKLL